MTDNRTIRLSDAIKVVQDNLAFSVKADIIKALSALPAVEGWLPIESADKDTGYCIFYGATRHDCSKVFSGWVAINGMCYTDSGDICHPTHWLTLPAPPEIE